MSGKTYLIMTEFIGTPIKKKILLGGGVRGEGKKVSAEDTGLNR